MKTYEVNCGQIGIRQLTMQQIETLYLSCAKCYTSPHKKGRKQFCKVLMSFQLSDTNSSGLFYRYVFVILPPSYAPRFPSFD